MVFSSFVFRFLYRPLAPVAIFFLHFIPNEKIKRTIALRTTTRLFPPWPEHQRERDTAWIHISSGEIEYVRTVVKEMRLRHPQVDILLSYFSPSVEKVARSLEGVHAVPLPWDTRRAMNKFINYYQPDYALIGRTDLWPEMLIQCRLRKIPTILFSFTLSEKSPKLHNRFSRGWFRWLLSLLTEIHCVSEKDQEVLKKLEIKTPSFLTGDTRYDRVAQRLSSPSKVAENFWSETNQPILILGSTWPPDEEQILLVAKDLLKQPVGIIWAPHEPTPKHLEGLTEKFQKLELPFSFYSKTTHWNPERILLVDQVGLLADFYRPAQFAFVGNSFVRPRVHSVLEPLACGCRTFFGPYHQNNREALQFKEETSDTGLTFAQPVLSGPSLLEEIQKSLKTPGFHRFKEELKSAITKKEGATLRLVNHLEKHYLKKPFKGEAEAAENNLGS